MTTKRFASLRNLIGLSDDLEDEGTDTELENGEGDEEGEDQGCDEGEGQGGDEGEEGSDDAGDEGASESQASFTRGVTAERRRWAQVLTSDEAEGRFELAVDLLGEGMEAGAIKRVLAGQPQGNSLAQRLRTTPKHDTRGAPGAEGGRDASAAAESRKRAVESANRGRTGTGTTNAKKRIGARGGKEN